MSIFEEVFGKNGVFERVFGKDKESASIEPELPPKQRAIYTIEIVTEEYSTNWQTDRRMTLRQAQQEAFNRANYGSEMEKAGKPDHFMPPSRIKRINYHNMEEENASKPEPKNNNNSKS